MVLSTFLSEHFIGIFTPFCVKAGVSCLVAQCLLYLLLKLLDKSPSTAGPWSRRAGFTAHQIVTLPTLTYLTLEGMYLWFYESGSVSPQDRLLDDHEHARHLTEFVLGMMAFWDIPTSLLTRELRQPAMIAHHPAMFWTAAIAMGCLSPRQPLMAYYAPFYMGFIELSSLPLLIVDIFHPKHKDWNAWLNRYDSHKWLAALNSFARTCFAVLFIIVRTVWFPYVSVAGVLRDVVELRRDKMEAEASSNADAADDPSSSADKVITDDAMFGLYVMASLNIFFSLLQLYWGRLVLHQIVKAVSGGGGGGKSKEKKE